jgi:hypothetical protein
MQALMNMAPSNLITHGAIVLVAAIVVITSFAFLIPLDSVSAVTGVTIILAVAYGIALVGWAIVIALYGNKNEGTLVWLNTHLIFLVLLPATIAATAMNVTSVQNTRNLLTMGSP